MDKKKQSSPLGEFIARELQGAIEDVRAQFEEAFYGRNLTPRQPMGIGEEREAHPARDPAFIQIQAPTTINVEIGKEPGPEPSAREGELEKALANAWEWAEAQRMEAARQRVRVAKLEKKLAADDLERWRKEHDIEDFDIER